MQKNFKLSFPSWSQSVYEKPIVSAGVVLLLLIANLILQRIFGWIASAVLGQIIIGVIGIAIPFAISYINKKIDRLRLLLPEISNENVLMGREYSLVNRESVLNKIVPNVVPIITAILGLYTLDQLGTPWGWERGTFFPLPAAIAVFFVALFWLTGLFGWMFFAFAAILNETRNLEIMADIFEWPINQFRKIHQLFLDVYFIGFIVYLGTVIGVLLLPFGNLALVNSPLGTLWAFPLAFVVVFYFVFCEYQIHNLMVSAKETRLAKLDKELGRLFVENKKVSTNDKANLMKEMIAWRRIISDEPDWPISIQSSLSIIGGALLPIIGGIIDLVSRYL